MRLARALAVVVAVIAITLASSLRGLAYETTSSQVSWGHWVYGPPLQFVNWTDGYAGYFDWRDYTGYHLDKSVWQHAQGGCVTNSNISQVVTGSVTYYWPGGSKGPLYSQGGTTACPGGTFAWGGGAVSVFPSVLFLSTDSYKYAYICSTWLGNATPNQFTECRSHNY